MGIQRWYEKNPDLLELVTFMENLESEEQNFVANHILQILVNECGINLDEELSKFSKNNYSYKRWYDEDVCVSNMFELLKSLSDEMQNYVVKRALVEIIMAYAKKEL